MCRKCDKLYREMVEEFQLDVQFHCDVKNAVDDLTSCLSTAMTGEQIQEMLQKAWKLRQLKDELARDEEIVTESVRMLHAAWIKKVTCPLV